MTTDMTAAPVVLSAVPTLFDADGEVDPDANQALYKLVAGLVDGLLVAGTTGEFPALEDAERLSLFELALAEAGPDRVIAHIGAPDARHAARLAREAVALGATRIAAITPYYLPARPGELADHYRRIREAVPGPEFYAYIFPERTGLPAPLSIRSGDPATHTSAPSSDRSMPSAWQSRAGPRARSRDEIRALPSETGPRVRLARARSSPAMIAPARSSTAEALPSSPRQTMFTQ